MDIRILHYAEGAATARGITVIIDVFRAFSMACYAVDRGAAKIVATGSIDYALEYKRRDPAVILVGERFAKKIEGFDFGNSPSEILDVDLSSRTVVQTTHAGTRALVAATEAEDVITGSFVNAGAIIRYIRTHARDAVSLVCAGFEGNREALEDLLCARYIEGALRGNPAPFDSVPEQLRDAPSARRFFDPDDTASPRIDFDLCMALDRFDFVIRKTGTLEGAVTLEKMLLPPNR